MITDRNQDFEDQAADSYVDPVERLDAYEAWAEAEASRWDDDPSPYNGDYSEM